MTVPGPFTTAVGLFTTIPVPPALDLDRRKAGRAIAALPWVGTLIGLVAGGLAALMTRLGLGLLGAVLALAVLALVTGGLHLDGVADTADGLGSRKSAADALAIMKRSDIGPMGVITLAFVLLLDVAAVAHLTTLGPWWPVAGLAVAATTGRLAVLWATTTPDAARPGGFGALFSGATSRVTATVCTVVALGLAGAAGWWLADWPGALTLTGAVAVALGVGAAWAHHLRRRLGGMTGDTFGSLIEVGQTAALVTTVVAWQLLSLR